MEMEGFVVVAEDDGGVRAGAVVEAEGEGGAGVVVGGCLGW